MVQNPIQDLSSVTRPPIHDICTLSGTCGERVRTELQSCSKRALLIQIIIIPRRVGGGDSSGEAMNRSEHSHDKSSH